MRLCAFKSDRIGGATGLTSRRETSYHDELTHVRYSRCLITEVVVAPGKSLRIEAAGPNILRLANRLDYVKVVLDAEDDVFVRNEARVKSLNIEELKFNIERVAAAADKVFVELKPFRQAWSR